MNKEQGLESGRVLLMLKQRFLNDMSMETLMGILHCLVDSHVVLPMNKEMINKDLNMFNQIYMNEYVDEVYQALYPDIVKMEDAFYLPIFTNEHTLPDEYKKHFTLVKISAIKVLQMVKDIEDLKGMILDPFSEPFIVDDELLQAMDEINKRK